MQIQNLFFIRKDKVLFLLFQNLTVTDAARMLGVSRKALSEFVNEKASLSPEMAIRISKATNTSPESWMNMQQKLTLWIAQQNEPSNVIPFPLDAVKEG